MTRRILIAGLAGPLGAQLARELELDRSVDALVGIDERDPPIALDRTEFVRVGIDGVTVRRVLEAAAIDTVVDARLITDTSVASERARRRVNVDETKTLVAAAAAAGVMQLVLASSAHVYGCAAGDPAYFHEDMALAGRPSALEQQLQDAENAAAELRTLRPGARVAVLRLVDVAAADRPSALGRLLALPGVVPAVAGFDPRVQLLHPDDATAALEHATIERLDGTFNVAADGVLALSELASLLDRRPVPILPPWGTGLAAAPLRRLGAPLPRELLALLRHGRAVDNRRLKASGMRLRYTAREAAVELRRSQRVATLVDAAAGYRYDEGLEDFLKRSPAVRGRPVAPG